MANLSDAWGTVEVKKVGQEFIDYLKNAQEGAYYVLVGSPELDTLKPDKNGDLTFDFSAFGRWNFSANLEGYLNGGWKDVSQHLEKLLEAIVKKKGKILFDYKDCDSAMDWMGNGYYSLEEDDGDVVYSDDFDEERITLKGFAEFQGESIEWALEYLYGDEVIQAYWDYVEERNSNNKEAVDAETWYDTIRV